MLEIWTGLGLGLMGSFHCLGMCGPLVIALPHRKVNPYSSVIDGLLFNLSRAFAYSIIGALAGTIGASFALAGLQQKVSIIIGVFILMILIFPGIKKIIPGSGFFSSVTNNKLKPRIVKFMSPKSIPALMTLGFLNGFLPCGLVYIALAASIASGSIAAGALQMAAFGIGTIPLMLSLYYFKRFFGLKIRTKINRLIPFGTAIVAFLLIMRGLALGIPYLSPDLNKHDMKMGANTQLKYETPPCCK